MASSAVAGSGYLQRAPSPSGLSDVLDVILDKGLVVDAFVRISAVGIDLVTLDARIVIAGVDSYLRFAEAVTRLDLSDTEAGVFQLEEIAAKKVTEHKIGEVEEGVEDKIKSVAGRAKKLVGRDGGDDGA
jgi:gas vesicle structural protein